MPLRVQSHRKIGCSILPASSAQLHCGLDGHHIDVPYYGCIVPISHAPYKDDAGGE